MGNLSVGTEVDSNKKRGVKVSRPRCSSDNSGPNRDSEGVCSLYGVDAA